MKYPKCCSCDQYAVEYCELHKDIFYRDTIIDEEYGYEKLGNPVLAFTIVIPSFKCIDCWIKVYGKTKNDDTIYDMIDGKPYAKFVGDSIKGRSGRFYSLPKH